MNVSFATRQPGIRYEISELPRKQMRVLTWPLVTVFGFIAQPELHMFLKPTVTERDEDCRTQLPD